MMRALLAAGIAIVLGAGGAGAQDSPTDTARLRFAWPDSVDARVVMTRYRERVTETSDTSTVTFSYRMLVRPHAEGRSITYTDFGLGGTLSAIESSMFQELVGNMVPSIIVDHAGQFVRIANIEDIRRSIGAMFDAIPDSTGELRATMDRIMTPQLLTALSAQQWNAVVGYWIDADLEIEALYQLEEEVELPVIPGSRVPMTSDIAVYGRVDCVEGSGRMDCIEAGVVTRPDPDAVAAALTEFVQSFAPGEPLPFQFTSLDVETEVALVAEPATLLPHWFQERKWASGTGEDTTGSGEFSQLDVKTYEYTYE